MPFIALSSAVLFLILFSFYCKFEVKTLICLQFFLNTVEAPELHLQSDGRIDVFIELLYNVLFRMGISQSCCYEKDLRAVLTGVWVWYLKEQIN